MRLAGTWKQYSKNAMPQLARMTFQRASLRYLRCPYQAKVIKIFEMVSKRIVRTRNMSPVKDESRTSNLFDGKLYGLAMNYSAHGRPLPGSLHKYGGKLAWTDEALHLKLTWERKRGREVTADFARIRCFLCGVRPGTRPSIFWSRWNYAGCHGVEHARAALSGLGRRIS